MPEYAQIDMSASVENLLLAADSLGLGAVWLGIAPLKERMEAVRTVLNVPENLNTFAIIPCGYPETVHASYFDCCSINKNSRQSCSTITSSNTFVSNMPISSHKESMPMALSFFLNLIQPASLRLC